LSAIAALLAAAGPLAAQGGGADRLQVALGLLQRGLHEEAAGQLEKLLSEQKDHPRAGEASYRLGTARSELGQKEAAIAAFERALGPLLQRRARDQRPAYLAECRYRLAHLRKETGQPEPALAQFDLLLAEQEPDHYLHAASAWAAGELHAAAGRKDQALAQYQRAAETDAAAEGPYAAPALYAAGFLLLDKSPKQAAERFALVAQRYGAHALAAECRYLHGEALLRAGEPAAAATAFAPVASETGEWADDALLGLGRAQLARDDQEAALRSFRKLATDFAESPHAARARVECARILHQGGRHAEAARELGGLDGSGVDGGLRDAAIELRAIALLEAKQPAEAVALLEPAVAVVADERSRARLHNLLGDALGALGRWADARAAYAPVADSADRATALEAQYGLALADHKLGRHEESLQACRKLLRSKPDAKLHAHAAFALAENLFALARYDEAMRAYGELPDGHPFGGKPRFKQGWCAYLAKRHAEAAGIFAEVARGDGELAAEALSLEALTLLEAGDADRALATADRYLARHERGAHRDRCERIAARVLRERGDLAAAERRLARAASAAGSPDAGAPDQLQVAELQFRRGDFEAAKRGYTALAARPDVTGAAAATGLAWCAFELGDDRGCEAAIVRALAHPSAAAEKPALLELAAACYGRMNRHAEAAEASRRFLAEFEQHERAPAMRLNLAIAQARGGDARAALGVLEPLAQQPAGVRADRVWYEIAWARRKLGDEPGAARAFAEVAKTSQDPELGGEANLHVGEHLLASGDKARGRAALEAATGSHRARALYRLGFSWLEEDRFADAARAFAGIVALDDRELRDEARYLLGDCEARQQRFAEAAEPLRALLAANAAHPRAQAARLLLGRCELEQERAGEAARLLDAYLRGDQGEAADTARAWLWLGRARAELGEAGAAEQAFQRVTKLSNGDLAAEAQYRLGASRRARGDVDGAVEALLELSVLYGHEPWVPRGLALAAACYDDQKQPEKAGKLRQELRTRFPESEQARELSRAGGR
jgi:TolA-binding protein